MSKRDARCRPGPPALNMSTSICSSSTGVANSESCRPSPNAYTQSESSYSSGSGSGYGGAGATAAASASVQARSFARSATSAYRCTSSRRAPPLLRRGKAATDGGGEVHAEVGSLLSRAFFCRVRSNLPPATPASEISCRARLHADKRKRQRLGLALAQRLTTARTARRRRGRKRLAASADPHRASSNGSPRVEPAAAACAHGGATSGSHAIHEGRPSRERSRGVREPSSCPALHGTAHMRGVGRSRRQRGDAVDDRAQSQ